MTLKAVENEYHDPADKQDQITLEQIRDGEADNIENIAPTPKGGRKKRKQNDMEDNNVIQVVLAFASSVLQGTDEKSCNLFSSLEENVSTERDAATFNTCA